MVLDEGGWLGFSSSDPDDCGEVPLETDVDPLPRAPPETFPGRVQAPSTAKPAMAAMELTTKVRLSRRMIRVASSLASAVLRPSGRTGCTA